MKGRYEEGLKKGTKVSKNVEKKENPKGNKTSVSYGHAKEKKIIVIKKIYLIQNQIHPMDQMDQY